MVKSFNPSRNFVQNREDSDESEMKSVRLLKRILRENGIANTEDEILPLRNALEGMPQQMGIAKSIDDMIVQTIENGKKEGISAQNLYYMSIGIISGANCVIGIVTEPAEGA